MDFKELHDQETPLIICNVWDVQSAKIAQKLDFQAIGTSSAAIASTLGYSDGEEMSFKELKYIIERIAKSVNTPLSVDLEAGYGRDPDTITKNIIELTDLGVKGINIEDSEVGEKREILSIDNFSKRLEKICSKLIQLNQDVFINVRTDTFLLNVPNTLNQTLERVKSYVQSGANGIFIPKISKVEDIKIAVENSKKPVNVMCVPNLPNFEILKELGVKRISMGPFPFIKFSKTIETEFETIIRNKSFDNLFEN